MSPEKSLSLLHQMVLQESFVATKELLKCAKEVKVSTPDEMKRATRFLNIVDQLIKEVGGGYNALLQAKSYLESAIKQQQEPTVFDDDL